MTTGVPPLLQLGAFVPIIFPSAIFFVSGPNAEMSLANDTISPGGTNSVSNSVYYAGLHLAVYFIFFYIVVYRPTHSQAYSSAVRQEKFVHAWPCM